MSCNPPSAVAVSLDGELAVRVREKRVAEHRIAVLLAQVRSGGHHRAFGYAKLVDYAVDRHGLSPGHAKGLAQLGDRLPELPLLDRAMADGRLDWTKARHVARIATAATEAAWIELASTSTNRALEDAVRSSQDGSVAAQVVPEDEVRLVLRMSAAEAENRKSPRSAEIFELVLVRHSVVDAAHRDQVPFGVRTAVGARADVVQVEPQAVRAAGDPAPVGVPVEDGAAVAGGIERVT